MNKIAFIGAGSFVFTKPLLNDLLMLSALDGWEFSLMSPDLNNLSNYKKYITRVITKYNLSSTITVTNNQKQSIKNAAFVITLFNIGGNTATESDYKIPLSFGIDQCIGDSLGPGGIFRAQRSIPVFINLLKDMKELCPNAWLINFVNPMAPLTMAAEKMGWNKYIGLCNGVNITKKLISAVLNKSGKELDFLFAGINHMTWLLELEHEGIDLYPNFRKQFSNPGYFSRDRVRFEILQNFGFFVTESSGHLSDLLPWFRRSGKTYDRYCKVSGYAGASGAYNKLCKLIKKRTKNIDLMQFEDGHLNAPGDSQGPKVIEALITGKYWNGYGNISNTHGLISNLPIQAAVELTCEIINKNLYPVKLEKPLPLPLAAMNRSNIIVQELCLDAALKGDPEILIAALALDPLTLSVLDLPEIRKLTTRMLQEQSEWLPQYKNKAPLKTINIEENLTKIFLPIPKESIIEELIEYKKKVKNNRKSE